MWLKFVIAIIICSFEAGSNDLQTTASVFVYKMKTIET